MKETTNNPHRILGHLKRLMREGDVMLHDRPLDELAHAMWCDRAVKYISRKMPDVQILRVDELVPVTMPDLMDKDRQPIHPLDAAIARSDSGRELVKKYMTILASAIERLELKVENEDK